MAGHYGVNTLNNNETNVRQYHVPGPVEDYKVLPECYNISEIFSKVNYMDIRTVHI